MVQETDEGRNRATYLLDGRRVMLRDLLEDGQAFATPAKAAAAAADVRAMDGWRVWTVDGSGCSLDALGRQLLDGVAVGSARAGDEVDDRAARYEFLRDARSGADAGEPVAMTVRELLAHWAARTSG